jgi:hypothetical protein
MEPEDGASGFQLVVENDHVTPAQCEGVVTARMENPLRVENGHVEQSVDAHDPKDST